MFKNYKVIHFVGIGGIGMSGIAEILHNLSYEVTGSDMKASETTERLKKLGLRISIGHSPENVGNAHVVVISSAVSGKNPEVMEAQRRGIPVIPRAEMLAELGRLKYGILVAGAHGKTTTTSLIATVLASAGLDPTVVIGGKLKAMGSNARLGQGQFIVAEADESDGSFLKLSPTISVVTNIDREHMEFFRTMQALKEGFLCFMNKVPFYGVSVVCIDDGNIRELLPLVHRRVFTYGFSEDAELRAGNLRPGFMSMGFDVFLRGRSIGGITLPMPGEHNVLNSLASISAGLELNIPFETVTNALKEFEGIQRRLEFKGEASGIRVYDDYGHHPTEIKATLKALKESMTANGRHQGKLYVVFQPHRFTRTKDLFREFAGSFGHADYLALMDIYSAGERPIEGISSGSLFEEIRKARGGDVVYGKDKDEVLNSIAPKLKEGDVVLTLGAGDVWKVSEEFLRRLKG